MNSEKSIFNLSKEQVRRLLLKSSSYCTTDLPEYFNFQPILDALTSIDDSNLSPKGASGYENVNYRLLLNKDGKYAWRQIELMHPIIYTHAVNQLVSEWDRIASETLDTIKNNSENGVICTSQYWVNKNEELAEPPIMWWKHFEQATVASSLDYSYIHKIDISGCYDSIYTHSLAWALNRKEIAKNHTLKTDGSLVGNKIDNTLRSGRFNQSNGLPQGSLLCDLLACIILIDIDNEISNKLKTLSLRGQYRILRYVDDYNILTEYDRDGEVIVKAISEVLALRRMKINTQKCVASDNIIISATKLDKIAAQYIPQATFIDPLLISDTSMQDIPLYKRLLQIYNFSLTYTNSGTVKLLLLALRSRCDSTLYLANQNIVSSIAILTQITKDNPGSIKICVSIIERLLSVLDDPTCILGKLISSLRKLPNNSYLDLWLQRMALGRKLKYTPNSDIAKYVIGRSKLWCSKWVSNDNAKTTMNISAIDSKKLDSLQPEIKVTRKNLWSYDD